HGQNANGMPEAVITSNLVSWIKSAPRPSTQRRAELYLEEAIRTLGGKLIGRIDISAPRLRVASWSASNEDTLALANYLVELGALEDIETTGQQKRMRAKGHLLHEEWSAKRAISSQAFIAMWFSSSMADAFSKGLARGVEEAGYDAVRVDPSRA